MKLSTHLQKKLWWGYFTAYGCTTRPVTLMVDCNRTANSSSLSKLDKYHRDLVSKGCKLLPANEWPVVNDHEIIVHYTSTTYKDWCKAPGEE